MTRYICATIHITEPALLETGILAQALSEIGFESFEEKDCHLLAYAPETAVEEKGLAHILNAFEGIEGYTLSTLAEENWNALWEASYPPMRTESEAGILSIRASFHPLDSEAAHSIIIDPKMSFGTGHHATTSLMMRLLARYVTTTTSCLDMGCGTGVLAILAAKLGAKHVVAIDNDPWAFENTLENTARNEIQNVQAIHGGFEAIPPRRFDIIAANLTLNLHLGNLSHYTQHLTNGGILLASGFYNSDTSTLQSAANQRHLELLESIEQNEWAATAFKYRQ